jgi:hypothetical protein
MLLHLKQRLKKNVGYLYLLLMIAENNENTNPTLAILMMTPCITLLTICQCFVITSCRNRINQWDISTS